MEPTSVPTHSAEIGTSCSTTGSTLTSGGGGGWSRGAGCVAAAGDDCTEHNT